MAKTNKKLRTASGSTGFAVRTKVRASKTTRKAQNAIEINKLENLIKMAKNEKEILKTRNGSTGKRNQAKNA